MKKMTKISAAALFALFLTACDKPATNNAPAEAPKAEATKVEAPKTAEAPKATEAPKAEESAQAVDPQGVADFKKISDWNVEQEKKLSAVQNELQQQLSSGDTAKIEEALKSFTGQVSDVLASLDSLEIKNEQVNAFKAQTKETLTLSNELIAESVKAMANPNNADAQKSIQAKTEALLKSGQVLQKLQAELQQKFGAK